MVRSRGYQSSNIAISRQRWQRHIYYRRRIKVACALSNSPAFKWPWVTLKWTPVSRSQSQYSLNGAFDPLHVWFYLAQGFQGRQIEWRCLRFDKIQDGGQKPSRYTKIAITLQPVRQWRDWCLVLGWRFRLSLDFYHRAFIHALLLRVTLASARFSFLKTLCSAFLKSCLQTACTGSTSCNCTIFKIIITTTTINDNKSICVCKFITN